MAEEEKSFVIKDRRRFASQEQENSKSAAGEEGKTEGQPSSGKKAEERKQPESEKPEENTSDRKTAYSTGAGPTETHLPKINFSTFILSLNSSALVQLGLIEDPASGKKEKNLPLAKQTIDIIGMLDEKTKGNLTDDEQRMIRTLLYDLRMMYVREAE